MPDTKTNSGSRLLPAILLSLLVILFALWMPVLQI